MEHTPKTCVLSPLTFWLSALTLSKYYLYGMETDHKICEIFFHLSWLEKKKNKYFINSYSELKYFEKHHFHKKMDWQNATMATFYSNKFANVCFSWHFSSFLPSLKLPKSSPSFFLKFYLIQLRNRKNTLCC